MGATGWRYRVDYTNDTEAALQGLRRQVFQRSQYPFREAWPPAIRRKHFVLWLVVSVIGWFHSRWLKARIGTATDIESLIEQAGTTGTHSILDITHVSKNHDFGAAVPASERTLLSTFGTTTPTLADYDRYSSGESAVDDIAEDLEGWQAIYFNIYDNNEPRWLCFEGFSGD